MGWWGVTQDKRFLYVTDKKIKFKKFRVGINPQCDSVSLKGQTVTKNRLELCGA
jgi:hypothetical protein